MLRNKLYILFLPLLASFSFFFVSFFGDKGYFRMQEMKRAYNQDKLELQKVSSNVNGLHSLIYKLNNDPIELEKIARTMFGMKKDGEQILIFKSKLEQ